MNSNHSKFVPTPGLTARERLASLRQALGMTRNEFGELAGLTYHQLTNIERGKQTIPADVYVNIARRYPHYIPWLVMDDWEWEPTESQRNEVRELINKYKHSNDEH